MPYARGLYYREEGQGEPPIVILHGGWGYGFYPFDDAIARLPRRFVIPDRAGYGKSPALDRSRSSPSLPRGFHRIHADEMLAVLDELSIERCVLWGHSDGAVIAILMALRDPARCKGVVVEALHLDREKRRSREFFTKMARDPDAFGERVAAKLESDHGKDWRTIIRADGQAWLDIAATPDEDLFEGRLHELAVPLLALHGTDDPRTEAGELDRLRREVPRAEIHMIEGGLHAPHCERQHAAACTDIVARFLAVLPSA
jgi:pimeloyl-ACP methyl ester carboxylesterase